MIIYLVGGAVRDELLGLAVTERDWLVVGATAQEMLDLGYQQVGKDFPVFLHPSSKEEYALARKERKSGKGYGGFDCISDPSISLEDDLLRRDLTINAIAKTADGKLIDPFNGISDINKKLLRHVSQAFSEDPLRVLRTARFAARFHALGFTIEPETFALMTKIASGDELAFLSPERVWQESRKALACEHADVYFQSLFDCKALTWLMPELENKLAQKLPAYESDTHELDNKQLSPLQALRQAAKLSTDIGVRFAALTHTLDSNPNSDLTQNNAEKPLLKALCQRLKLPKQVSDLALMLSQFYQPCWRVFELDALQVAGFLQQLDAYRRPERLRLFVLAALACNKNFAASTTAANKPADYFPQGQYLLDCYQQAHQVSAKHLNTEGMDGKAIGQFVEQARIKAIQRLNKQDYHD